MTGCQELRHGEHLALFLAEQQWGEVEQQIQWQREADEVRAAALCTPAVAPDPVATEFLSTMLKGEELGIARWDERKRDWYRIRAVPKKTNRVSRQTSRRVMTVADLQRFEKLRSTGPGRWTACCPAHEDRTPSLSIRLTRDRWLFHCHAQGCDFRDIMRAVGLTDLDLRVKP
jgi:hypothetical protein